MIYRQVISIIAHAQLFLPLTLTPHRSTSSRSAMCPSGVNWCGRTFSFNTVFVFNCCLISRKVVNGLRIINIPA